MNTKASFNITPEQSAAAVQAALMVVTIDMDGIIVDVSDPFCAVSGYPRSELVGHSIRMLADPKDDGAAAQTRLFDEVRQGKTVSGTFRRKRRDGTPFWISATYQPLRNDAGEVIATSGYCIDISEWQNELQLAKSKQAALERAQAVIQFTPTGDILWVNTNFLDVMGYTLDEIKGKHHRIFCSPEFVATPEYRQMWDDLAAGGLKQFEAPRYTKSGAEVWLGCSYNALLDADGKTIGVMKFARDITERYTAVSEMISGLEALAEGDLTTRLSDQVKGDFNSVRNSFNNTVESLEQMVKEIRHRAEEMNREAGGISRGATEVSRRGESQAAALEETAAAVEEISGNITMTSESSRDADGAAREALNVVLKGVEVVSQAIAAIERIDEHTKQMGDFTRVIEGFAFQTNLLSINAAVEAARAGEVGRGFAVVANEVRNLAQQSAKASQNIAELIGKSETEVRSGVKLVRDAGTSLERIQTAVSGVVENITGIAHATTEQSQGVREVSDALSQLDGVNQANLAMSEEFAAAAAGLSTQVEELGEMMSRFETSDDRAADIAKLKKRSAA